MSASSKIKTPTPMRNLYTPSREESLCVCTSNLDACSVKNAIQSVSSIYVSIEKRNRRSFVIKVKDYNYKKAVSLIMNNCNIMMNVKPLILVKEDEKATEVPVRKMIPTVTNNIA